MTDSMDDILHPTSKTGSQEFPYAPAGWDTDVARDRASEKDIELTEDHWAAISALQELFARNAESSRSARKIHDALGEKFHAKGGMKYLYLLFPGGPVNQGCQIAGLNPPAGSLDKGFGSVQ